MTGPLDGVTVIELAGLGPAPFAGMVLADLGADVVRIDRPGAPDRVGHGIINRSRTNITLDLKDPRAIAAVVALVGRADGLIEGFRPGVLERLGLGPDVLLAANPALVVGRMTGWGQDGPWAHMAGHDIDYIAVTGALGAIGRRDQPPTVPLNLVGDFGGGAMFLVTGLLAAILHARATGQGQVVDAAMVDGTSALLAMFHDLRATGLHGPDRGTNLLDSGSWFYDVYQCADGEWIALGALEAPFRVELCARLGLGRQLRAAQETGDDSGMRAAVAAAVAARTRDELDELLAGTDACYAPVLDLDEARHHPQLAARSTLVEVDGVVQPSPVPRFSATPPTPPRGHDHDVDDTDRVLAGLGLTPHEIASLRRGNAPD